MIPSHLWLGTCSQLVIAGLAARPLPLKCLWDCVLKGLLISVSVRLRFLLSLPLPLPCLEVPSSFFLLLLLPLPPGPRFLFCLLLRPILCFFFAAVFVLSSSWLRCLKSA